MSDKITIRINGEYGSIGEIVWDDVPPFAVLTGVNGTGKSQFLEILAASYDALRPPVNAPLPSRGDVTANATLEGVFYKPGEVFHTYGEWRPITVESVNADAVRDAISGLHYQSQKDVVFPPKVGIEEFVQTLTPGMLWNAQNQAEHQFDLTFLFQAYRLFERDLRGKGLDKEEIHAKIGEPPWIFPNEILQTSGLRFQVDEPEPLQPSALFSETVLRLRLSDTKTGEQVPFQRLSSGEKVIMSTILWWYNAEKHDKHYKLLLLDEPDAHLHPSLTRRFLEVIQRVFVEKRGVRVIMTTHSPSTVALAPPESLFEMRRSPPRIRRVEKQGAIAVLTEGLVVVHEGTRTVLVEGVNDPPFYETVWSLLSNQSSIGEQGPLEPMPNLSFVYGQGKNVVVTMIPQMRAKGMWNFHGIIDRDLGNSSMDGIYVLGRNAIENYLFDPIVVWALLNSEGSAPPVAGVKVSPGREAYISSLPNDELQKIVDVILTPVESALPSLQQNELTREPIRFVGGKQLQYPHWFLYRDDKEVQEHLRKVYGYQFLKTERLRRFFATVNLVPEELLSIFRAIQSSGKP